MADVHAIRAAIELKFVAGFVDGVVGEVHEEVAEILFLWSRVG